MKTRIILLATLVLVGCSDNQEGAGETAAVTDGAISTSAQTARSSATGRKSQSLIKSARGKTKPTKDATMTNHVATEDRTDLSEDNKRLLLTVEKSLEDEKLSQLLPALSEIAKCDSAEVRSEAIDALGWFGRKAMDELLPFMADSDPAVAQNALDTWTSSLGEVEDEREKVMLVDGVMQVLTDKDTLESLVIELNDCEDELSIPELVNLINCNNPVAAEVARDHYEFVTGEEYTTPEAAETWLKENAAEE